MKAVSKKKRYLISTREVWVYFYEVEAKSKREAINIVNDGKVTSNNGEYSHRLESKYWDVEEINGE